MSISGLESHSQPHDSGLWHTQVLLTSPGWSTQYSRAVHGDKARPCQWALVKESTRDTHCCWTRTCTGKSRPGK